MVGVRLPTHNTLKTTTMTKENFITKWAFKYNVNYTTNPYFIDDLEAVIAHEIAKVQEAKLKHADQVTDQEQPALNPIEQAYERGEKIRHKDWLNGDWIKKHKETKTIDNHGNINSVYPFAFIQYPEKWELYTEPTEQPSSQVMLDNPFDRDRFEAMFRAVVASGRTERWEQDFKFTEEALAKLDAYYAEKGGANE